MKSIIKLSPAKFKISTIGVPQSELELDFNPIIAAFDLTGDYQLVHWQARPKGEREWGIYSSFSDSYRSIEEWKNNCRKLRSLQLDDKTTNTLPSAVLHIPTRQITCINDLVIIGDVLLADVA